ncbi:hypothetical protein ACFOOK_26190 [Micromonospora krabiensis]|uniref:PD-(D/E)XK nuclease superfamily protein n=1 Tax=Micromonospora krabiensis TaxID=307121 RepID=A0A1C3N5T7_9ACTN|nr:hypothetical protein [Micromonospora krabiensis]SBV27944.1 hypothetical protein GA0070620_3475 [Micromonospora krabiensis]
MALARLDAHKERVRGAGGNRDVPRNGKKQPLIIPLGEDGQPDTAAKLKPYTRMTTYIDCLDDKTNLTKWGKRLVLVGLAKLPEGKRADLVAEILEADERGDKNKLNAIAERMHKAAGGNDKADQGDWLHELSEYADKGEALPAKATEEDLADIAAYKLATIDLEVKEIEHFVVLDEHKVGGTPDRMSWYAGPDPDGLEPAGHLITDLKTGRVDYGGLKMAMQLAGYGRGKKYDPQTGVRTPWPDDLNLNWGLIINAPAGTGTCEVLWVDLRLGWDGFLLAKDVRAIRNRGRRAFRPYPSPGALLAMEEDAEEGEE